MTLAIKLTDERRKGNITTLCDFYNKDDITLQRADIKSKRPEFNFLEATRKITKI